MAPRLASVWMLWLTGYVARADEEPRTCQLQGTFEKLPGKVTGLPFCEQYCKCTCCHPRHALTVREDVLAMSLSPACLAITAMMTCRVCDPDVGVGGKQGICPGTCDRWYEDCKRDYFAFRELRGTLVPCSHGSLICSELQDLAESGADLCTKAGYAVESGEGLPCFDGSVPPEEDCPSNDGHMGELWFIAVIGVGLVALFVVFLVGGAALSFKMQAQQLAQASKSSKHGFPGSIQSRVPADAAQLRQRRLEKFNSS